MKGSEWRPKKRTKLVLREDRDRPSRHRGRCKGWRSNWLMRKTDRERRLGHVGGGLYQRGAALSGDPNSDLTADSVWTRRFPGDVPSASALTTVRRQKTSRQTYRLMNIDLLRTHTPATTAGGGGQPGVSWTTVRGRNSKKPFALSLLWELALKNELEEWWILLKMSTLASDIYIFLTLHWMKRGRRAREGWLQSFSGLNQNWALKESEDPSWGARSPGLF